jgi:hypothetical protein
LALHKGTVVTDLQKRAILALKTKALNLLQKGKTFSYLYEEIRACRYFGCSDEAINNALNEVRDDFGGC